MANHCIPIVCGASLFDLSVKDGSVRPDKEMGYKACIASEKNTFKMDVMELVQVPVLESF